MARPKRRDVLLDRLVVFCGRCGSPNLPVRTTKVIGYGSFFRGKDAPNDIDAIVVAPDDHALFRKFIGIVRTDLQGRDERNPAEEMRWIASQSADPEVARASDLFFRWLEGLSYDALFEAKNLLQEVTRFEAPRFAERMLGKGLPRIRFHVQRTDEFKTAQVNHIVWTADSPDVRGNVERIWSSDRRGDLLTEAKWFEKQARYYLLANEVLCRAIERLARDKIRVRGDRVHDEVRTWAEKVDIGFPPELVVKSLQGLLSLSDEVPDPPGYQQPGFDSMDTATLKSRVEELRKRLRCLTDRNRVLEVIEQCLVHRQFVERKLLAQPLDRFLREAVEERMYRRELNLKGMQAVIKSELGRILSRDTC